MKEEKEISVIAVIGAGTMGHGIAQTAAAAGYTVRLHDVSEDALRRGIEAIGTSLTRAVEKGKLSAESRSGILSRVAACTDPRAALSGVDLVVEAAPESIELKQRIFREIEASAPRHAVLATNTSSLSVGRIAEATSSPERVIGMHFFNPVPVMPLLEVVRARQTDGGTVEAAVDVARRMGKEPIVVRDSPGFATSRLGVLLGLEAMRMVEENVASPEDIDKAMTLGYRHPMGPLRLTDLVGLDVRLAIAEHLHRELGSEAFRPPAILRRMVAEGKFGKKSGQGFYRWDGE